ncbi:hypothetical protein [Hymenobacter jeollabukensis]|uniref:Uncharacterized protein n=1 Tax=Hymenobacter jeollabukensis TaxID=2025313 RepID=A0A5R8WHU5_9BACT|nr:hypothetical protein [Hymenobacter jeollabukensis]TLM87406.1 hypothetical protein FDY95_25770 [Hymenobacter jeollabukensis]
MSLLRTIREFCDWTPRVPVWRQLLGVFLPQLLSLFLLGGGVLLQLRGAESVTYVVHGQLPRPTGGPWLLYVLGGGIMLFSLSYTLQTFNSWRRTKQVPPGRSGRGRRRG